MLPCVPLSHLCKSLSRGFSWSWKTPPPPPPPHYSVVKPHTQLLAPVKVSELPKHIKRPPYAETGTVDIGAIPKKPVIWCKDDILRLRESCYLARKVLEEVKAEVRSGTTTEELDDFARELIIINGAYPSPLNFHGFPKSISTSVNNVAAHGIPDSRPLVTGDILNIDVTVYFGGFHGDCSDTVAVGEVDVGGRRLMEVTEECVQVGIEACKPGNLLSGIGRAISKHATSHNCTIVPLFLGHGIGDFFHGPPDIYHSLNNYPGLILPGMVFTIEPVVCEGNRQVVILRDGWTAVTVDDSRTAQKEHTVTVTETGADILTI